MNNQTISPTSTIRKATAADKAAAIEILVHAFWEDPHINWFSGSGPDKEKKIRTMMSFSFEQSLASGEVFITEDQRAVAIWKNSAKQRMTLRLLREYLRFIWVYGIRKIRMISRLEDEIHSRYPGDRRMYYLWVLGTHPDHQGKGLGSQLMNPILAEAEQKGLDTYLETSTIRNLPIYEKKGFERYDKLDVKEGDPLTIYFMRKKPGVAIP